MTARRTATGIVVLGVAPLALAALAAGPAAAHGSMTDPVSRVAACFAEGPESPKSEACKAAVAIGGTQALYDWNGVNIANAAGKSRQLIPDGKLCSAGNDKFKGLDLARADWPSSPMTAGNRTFRYKGTAPHRGSFELYVTKDGYDPAAPLKWSDLEAKPFLKVTDPKLVNGDYVFTGIVPKKTGRHLIYSIWQRSDSPEAFYTCSDVVFGKDNGTVDGAVPAPSAPTEQEVAEGTGKSTIEHNGHGDQDASTGPGSGSGTGAGTATGAAQPPADEAADDDDANYPEAKNAAAPAEQAPESGDSATSAAAPDATTATDGADTAAAQPTGSEENLAETGADGTTPYFAIGGTAALAIGAAVMFGTVRRRAVASGRHGR
ncbi:lytic polysaccharide monooxygenase [Streptomyces liangshanensis]|uniref:Lytic polysaccharide monooxygenase n=1 Tax=Streptomyces liangshanensis TaxID=2717324 RepID=A0A6G9H5C4_9ACTN|nr:lytic polysaccharide monooxygenase [Streptomyces liangshanensis]QIQ05506.1 lytic polysaccharide monooxygenase [Streptomyces liangshanensis]